MVLRDQHQPAEALAALQKAVALEAKSAQLCFNLGTVLSDKGQLDEAAAAFHKAVELDPKYVPAYANLGRTLYLQRRLDEAAAALQKALALDPEHVVSLINWGLVISDMDRRDEAIVAPGDEFCIEAELNRPAYLYVLWIDTDGQVLPVYPWRPGHWEDRPPAERPVARLRRPEALDEFYKVLKGTPGMETLVLLARETPLPREADLRAELGQLPRPAVQELRATVWFEKGAPVRNRRGRDGRFERRCRAGDLAGAGGKGAGRGGNAGGPELEAVSGRLTHGMAWPSTG
jgi:tetratricopeptide (TPR) repeat protein